MTISKVKLFAILNNFWEGRSADITEWELERAARVLRELAGQLEALLAHRKTKRGHNA